MKKQTAGKEHLGELAPKFAELNDDVLLERYGRGNHSCRSVTAV